jgi:hypothetical protein
MSLLQRLLDKKVSGRADDWARMRDAAEIVRRFVLPALPKTIEDFKPADVVGITPYVSEDRSVASEIWVQFEAPAMADDGAKERAFGTVQKAASGLQKNGWLLKTASLDACDYREGMDVTLMATRTIPGGKRWFRSTTPDRVISLRITFQSLPDTPRCRIVESVEAVPASTRTVRRVICEDGEGIAALLPSTALAEGHDE